MCATRSVAAASKTGEIRLPQIVIAIFNDVLLLVLCYWTARHVPEGTGLLEFLRYPFILNS